MISVSGSSTALYGNTSASIDGNRRASGDTQGSGVSSDQTLASGVQTRQDQTVNESTASASSTTAQVQVVSETQITEASDSRGNIIDLFA